jgi:predicted nucleotidyltransferase
MPLKEEERETIIRIAREYGVRKVWLFGSMLDPNPETDPNDIDLAVEGVPKGKFIDFFAQLIDALPRSVDLVPMDEKPPMSILVRKHGKVIYG